MSVSTQIISLEKQARLSAIAISTFEITKFWLIGLRAFLRNKKLLPPLNGQKLGLKRHTNAADDRKRVYGQHSKGWVSANYYAIKLFPLLRYILLQHRFPPHTRVRRCFKIKAGFVYNATPNISDTPRRLVRLDAELCGRAVLAVGVYQKDFLPFCASAVPRCIRVVVFTPPLWFTKQKQRTRASIPLQFRFTGVWYRNYKLWKT